MATLENPKSLDFEIFIFVTLADLEDEDNWVAKEIEETGIELQVA